MTLKRVTRADVIVALAAVLASLIYFLSYARYGYIEDEGYLVEGVSRILDGQLIYRDFHHTYAPGRFYLFSLLFLIFGKNLLVVRITWAVLLALKAGLAYWIGRRLTSRPFALVLALIVTLLPGPWHKTLFSFSAFLLLLGMLHLAERPGPRSHLLIGLLTGAMAMFRQDVAAFGAVGILAVAAIRAWDRRPDLGLGAALRGFIREGAAYIAGILAVIVPVLIAFQAAGALGNMARGILVEGMKDNRTNQLPFPMLTLITDFGRAYPVPVTFSKLLFYLPPLSFAILAVHLIVQRARARVEDADALLVGALVLSIGCFNQSLWRSDFPHLYQSLQPAYLIIVCLLYTLFRWIGAGLSRPAGRVIIHAGLLILPLLLVCLPVLWVCGQLIDMKSFYALRKEGLYARSVDYTGSALIRSGKTERLRLDRAPLIVSEYRAEFLEQVGSYLDRTTERGESILSVPGFQLVYFLFDRRNPTRYIHVRRSLGSPDEEQAMIDHIAEGDTRVILFTEMAIDGKIERRFRIYARKIHDWIMENYHPDLVLGHLILLMRNERSENPADVQEPVKGGP